MKKKVLRVFLIVLAVGVVPPGEARTELHADFAAEVLLIDDSGAELARGRYAARSGHVSTGRWSGPAGAAAPKPALSFWEVGDGRIAVAVHPAGVRPAGGSAQRHRLLGAYKPGDAVSHAGDGWVAVIRVVRLGDDPWN